MTRRSLAVVLAAAALLPGSIGAQAADPVKPEYPRSDCTKRFIDEKGDVSAPPQVGATGQLKSSGLDIIGGFFRTTADSVLVFLEVDDMPTTMPNTDLAHRYEVEFKYVSTIPFKVKVVRRNPLYVPPAGPQPITDDGVVIEPAGTGGEGGLDIEKDFFWVRIPRAGFEAKAGTPIEDGAKFEVTKFETTWMVNTTAAPQPVDKITPTGDAAKWTVFDDYCFGAPPAKLSDLTVKNVQYGDATTMTAKLVSDKDVAIAGKPVSFAIAGDPVAKTVSTNASGIATATWASKALASSKPIPVTVTFAGDDTDGKAKLTGTIMITPEKTLFGKLAVAKPSATARTVTATLLDDDKKAVAGQKVEFLVNGKKVATVVTNSKGQAVYKGAKAGQYVQTRLLAVAGKYLASTSAKVRV